MCHGIDLGKSILLVSFKAFRGMAPGYNAVNCLAEVIGERRSTLRSASTSGVRLAVPRRSSCTRFGYWAICVAGQTAWNSLPESIRLIPTFDSFKRKLKKILVWYIICTVFVKRPWGVIITVWCYTSYQIHHHASSLDLSAFDTIDSVLLSHIQTSVGLGLLGTVHQWISSYLSSRRKFAQFGHSKSSISPWTSVVPQGSVLSSIWFTLFISTVSFTHPLTVYISSNTLMTRSCILQFHELAPIPRSVLFSLHSCLSTLGFQTMG